MSSKKRKRNILLLISLVLLGTYFLLRRETHRPIKAKVDITNEQKENTNSSTQIESKKNKQKNEIKDKTKESIYCWDNVYGKVEYIQRDRKSLSHRLKHREELSDFLSVDWTEDKFNPEKVNPRSKLGKLYQALAYSGDLYYDEKNWPYKNLTKSRKILEQLVESDSQNSYPLYFLALIELKSGNLSKAKKILLKASSKNLYNSYLDEFTRDLFLLTIDNRKDYIAGGNFFSEIPLPVTKNFKIFSSLSLSATEDLGKKMISKAIEVNGAGGDVLWNRLDHQIGIMLLRDTSSPEHSRTLNYKEYIDRNGGNEVLSGHSVEECRKILDFEFLKMKESILNALE